MDIAEQFLTWAKKGKKKIAIGILRPIPETIASLKKASAYADLIVVGAKVDDFENIVELDDDKASQIIIRLLKEKKVDGIVRGQVKDSYTLHEFYRQFGKEDVPSNRKIAASVMRKGEYQFFVTTCSIYQGLTLDDKKYEVDRTIRHMRDDMGIEPKIAIMSSLRPTSERRKYPELDRVAEINRQLNHYLLQSGYDSKEYFFEYETAVWDHRNLIVPSSGLVGNAWMKALLYLGGWELLACNYLDLDVVYEDGTRNEKDFYWHIVHAVALANGGK